MSLREAIKPQHDEAEQHRFVVLLLSGDMPTTMYADYLNNQLFCYEALEERAAAFGLLDSIEDIKRTKLIKADLEELGGSACVCESTKTYVAYLKTVPPDQLWAHIYVRHFADMYGGQMIKKVAPGSCRMYEFENKGGLIADIRSKLTDDLKDEAKVVFSFAIRLFDELAEIHFIQ